MSHFPDFNNLFRLDGKVAIVTGGRKKRSFEIPVLENKRADNPVSGGILGSRGLGLHAATAFLLQGAELVIVTARKAGGDEGIDQAVRRLNALPGIKGRAVGIAADVGKREEVAKLVEAVKQHADRVDILVANAGATWGGPFETTPDWSSAKVLDLNVRGIFNMVQLFQPMLEKGATAGNPSRIIIVSSTAARTVPHVGENGLLAPFSLHNPSRLPSSFLGFLFHSG